MFVWDEADFRNVLGVKPHIHVDALARTYEYKVIRFGKILTITFNPDCGDLEVRLWCDFRQGTQSPLFEATFPESPGARLIDFGEEKGLEIGGPESYPTQYDGVSPFNTGLRIWVEPQIRIKPFWFRPYQQK